MYYILRALVSFGFRFCFKKIVIIDRDKIPTDRPCLVVCNHPSGFLEPCLLACFVKVPLYFLVRGDIFEKKVLRWLLVQTHQIPIFRFRDGMAGMKKNKESIKYVLEILKKKKHLLIFAEGSTKQVRYIRPLQKGCAKIAYESLQEDPNLNLAIVPIGMTLTKPANFRGQVVIKIGDPIAVNDYLNDMNENAPQGIRKLTKDIKERMTALVPHIENKGHSEVLDQVLDLHSLFQAPKATLPLVTDRDNGVFQVIEKSSSFVDNQDDESISNLTRELKKVQHEELLGYSGILWDKIKLVVLAIPGLLGILTCGLPVYLSKMFADKKVKEVEFYTSIWFAAALGIFVIYIPIVLIISISVFGKWGWLILIILSLLAFVAVQWLDSLRRVQDYGAYKKMPPQQQNDMILIKESILQKI